MYVYALHVYVYCNTLTLRTCTCTCTVSVMYIMIIHDCTSHPLCYINISACTSASTCMYYLQVYLSIVQQSVIQEMKKQRWMMTQYWIQVRCLYVHVHLRTCADPWLFAAKGVVIHWYNTLYMYMLQILHVHHHKVCL